MSSSGSIATAIASATSGAASSAATSAVSSSNSPPASYKVIGIILAVVSGLFIGSSFIVKKKALLKLDPATAGEGHAYLKSWLWWVGLLTMIVGEVCNTVAYAFADAVLVTPMGAISVVVSAILSSWLLKEKLSLFGKIGCFLCVVGAVIVALNGPKEQQTATIPEFQHLFISPGWLVFFGLVIAADIFLMVWVVPRYGKTHMLVHISICSLAGGISVVTLSGLGGAVLTSIRGNNQFKYWFTYILLAIVVVTLLVEINYLNKALALFNTAMVTPVYFVLFTGCTIISSVVLHRGFSAPAAAIVTFVLAFLVICCGITLLQLSKIDPTELKGKLDRRSTILLDAARVRSDSRSEKALDIEDPGIDTVRGAFGAIGSIHRAISSRRALRRDATLEQDGLRQRHGQHVPMTTAGTEGLVRHQLYDAPMPADALDKISMYSGRSEGHDSRRPTVVSPGPLSPGAHPLDAEGRPRASTITFAPADVVHTYNRQPGRDATHVEQQRIEGSHTHHYPLSPGSQLPPFSFDRDAEDVGDMSTGLPAYRTPFDDAGEEHDTFPPTLTLADILKGRSHASSDASTKREPPSPNSASSKFNLPFSRVRSSSRERAPSESGRSNRRGPRPSGPRDLDEQESVGLVHDRQRGEADDSDDSDEEGQGTAYPEGATLGLRESQIL